MNAPTIHIRAQQNPDGRTYRVILRACQKVLVPNTEYPLNSSADELRRRGVHGTLILTWPDGEESRTAI